MAAIPLDIMLYLSLGIFGLSVLMGIPMWFRNWRVRRGAHIPVTEGDLDYQTIARWPPLMGVLSTLSTLLLMASRALPFGVFMVGGVLTIFAFIGVAYRIDVARARRH